MRPYGIRKSGSTTEFVKEGYSVESKTVDGQIGVTYYIVVVAD